MLESIQLKLLTFQKDKEDLFNIYEYLTFLEFLDRDTSICRKQGIRDIQVKEICKEKKINNITWSIYSNQEILQGKRLKWYGDKQYLESPTNLLESIKIMLNSQIHHRKFKKLKDPLKNPETYNAYKISKTFGLSRLPEANVICFDIDSHPYFMSELEQCKQKAKQSLKYLLEYFNYPIPIYSEISILGGFHVYLYFKDKQNQEQLEQLIKEINSKYNTTIEIDSPNKILQCPNSSTYQPIQIFYADDKELFYEVIKGNKVIVNHLDGNYTKIQLNTPRIIKKEENKTFFFENHYLTEYKGEKNLYYGEGNRVNTWYQQGAIFVYWSKCDGTYNDFKRIILQYDQGSKDIKYHSDRVITEAFNFVTKKQNQFRKITSKQDTFISNKSYFIKQYELNLNQLRFLIKNQVDELFNYKSEKRKNNAYKCVEEIYIELLGRVIFEKEKSYKRKVARHLNFTSKKRNEFETGYIFDFSTFLPILKKKYTCVNVNEIFKVIMRNNLFFREYKKHIYLNHFKLKKRYLFKDKLNINNLFNLFLLSKKNNSNVIIIHYNIRPSFKNRVELYMMNNSTNLVNCSKNLLDFL